MSPASLERLVTSDLELAYLQSGPADGPPTVLAHGFPYAPPAYDVVADELARRGHRVIVPYLRGYGPTRFADPASVRSGQQAALGRDLRELIDGLGLEHPILVGYDWGGRGACIVSALWPERVAGLVSVTGYNIFGPPELDPRDPLVEHLYWYQYYLATHRGRRMLTEDRRAFCRHLWADWSPAWDFDDATFAASAEAFDNPDFVEVVLHSYRHRLGLVAGDPALAELEAACSARPPIAVPTVVLHGERDFQPPAWSEDLSDFRGPVRREVIPGAGHNLPQETPAPVIDAVEALRQSAG